MSKRGSNQQWLALALALVLAVLVGFILIGGDQQAPRHQAVRHIVPEPPKPAPEPVPQAKQQAQPQPGHAPLPQPVERGVALVIDDAGYDLPALQRLIDLHLPMAISVIPDAPHARQAAEMAHQAGLPVMLHLPMEPLSPRYQSKMTQAFLHEGMDAAALQQTFLNDLAMVPYVEGVNNHMGSLLTREASPMQAVMRLCREQQLFFVDSRTSEESVAAAAARDAGIAWAKRDIFLDHHLDTAFLAKQWNKARRCYRRGERCVVIAHPHHETVSFLEAELGEEDQAMMVSVRRVLQPPVSR